MVKREPLPRQATIFRAELHDIRLAINIIKDNRKKDFTIVSDSKSVVKILKKKWKLGMV